MAQVIIQPAAGRDAQQHLQDTINSYVSLGRFEQHLGPPDFDRVRTLFPSGSTQVWGVQPAQRTTWQRVQVGDLAYFSAHNSLFKVGTVRDSFFNHDLAVDLWGYDPTGNTWPYIYLLSDVREVSIPVPAFNISVGYKPNFTLRRFMVLDQLRSDLFIDAFNPGARSDEYRAVVSLIDAEPDRPSQTMARREQGLLREQLLRGQRSALCSICNQTFPSEFLIAAHIKPRSRCSTAEKLDIPNIAALMCVMGCDALYERGYITVRNGVIRSTHHPTDPVSISTRLSELDGSAFHEWTDNRNPYFAWHEANIGR